LFLDIFADFRAGVVWFGWVGIGPLPLLVLAGDKRWRKGDEGVDVGYLCLLGEVVWIRWLGDGEQVLDVESPSLWTGRGECWRGQLVFSRLVDRVEEETEVV
jgi:hypothetical protein